MAAAAFNTTASRGAPRTPAKIAVVIRAFSAASPPTSVEIGARAIEKSNGSIKSLEISPLPIVKTEVVVANVI